MPTIANRSFFKKICIEKNSKKNWLTNASAQILNKIEKLKIAYKGYDKIQPRIFPRSVSSMLPKTSSNMLDDISYYDQFTPSLGSRKIKKSEKFICTFMFC